MRHARLTLCNRRLFPNSNQTARVMLADRDGDFTADALNG
jgi:hypothetical protein